MQVWATLVQGFVQPGLHFLSISPRVQSSKGRASLLDVYPPRFQSRGGHNLLPLKASFKRFCYDLQLGIQTQQKPAIPRNHHSFQGGNFHSLELPWLQFSILKFKNPKYLKQRTKKEKRNCLSAGAPELECI